MEKKFKYLFFMFFILLIFFTNITLANYKSIIYGKANTNLKKPVFIVEYSDTVQGQISSKTNNYFESYINVLNYINKDDLDEIKKLNEIDFEYTIKIIPSTNNFPVKYKLIDINNGQEIALDSNLESEKITIGNMEEKNIYKLILEWDIENNNQNLDGNLDVEILVKGVQKNNG